MWINLFDKYQYNINIIININDKLFKNLKLDNNITGKW